MDTRMGHISKVILLFFVLFQLNFSPCFSSIYYVSKDGNDSYSKDEASNTNTPWRTIQYATDQLTPGDTLMIFPGIYSEVVNIRTNGSKDQRILICNYNAEEVIIDGQWNGNSHPDFPVSLPGGTIEKLWSNLWTVSGNHVTIKGIKWRNSPGRAISSSGSKNLIITDFHIETCYG